MKVRALPEVGFFHILEAIGIGFHQRIRGGVPERAVADGSIAVHIVVLDDRLIENVVAESLIVPGIDVLACVPLGVLGVVGGLNGVHPGRGVCADLIDVANDLSVSGLYCLPLVGVHLLQLCDVGSSLRTRPTGYERDVFLKSWRR